MLRRLAVVVGCVVALVCGGVGPAGAIEKEPSELFWTLLDQAEWGGAEAQYAVAMMYVQGTEVEKDDAEAAKWFKEAADQGHPRAMKKLGEMYEKGLGVEKSEEMALYWYKEAAKSPSGEGVSDAQYFETLKEVKMEEMAQSHEMEMLEKQQSQALKLQKQRFKHEEKMARQYDRYNYGSWRGSRYRGRRYYR